MRNEEFFNRIIGIYIFAAKESYDSGAHSHPKTTPPFIPTMKTFVSNYLLQIIAAALLFLSGGLAFAQTVFANESFESFAADAKITTGGKWTVTTSNANNYVQVISSDKSPFGTGSKAINFHHGSTNANGLTATHAFSETITSGTLTWSFDVKMPGSSLSDNILIELTTSASKPGPSLLFDRGGPGNFHAYNGSTTTAAGSPLLTLATDTWYHVVVTVDLDTRKYSAAFTGGAYAQSTTVFSNYSFRDGTSVASAGLSQIRISTNNAGVAGEGFYLDNLSVTTPTVVPEPATWTVLIGGAGLLIAIACRRHKCIHKTNSMS